MPTSLSPNPLFISLPPLLTALASASTTHQAPTGLLVHLSPILRQRVKYLASPSSPWTRHLSQDPALSDFINSLINDGTLEVHPLSELVEIDWEDQDIAIMYHRLDVETLNAYIKLAPLQDLRVKLVLTTNDPEETGSSWKIDGVFSPSYTPPDIPSSPSLEAAEAAFSASRPSADVNFKEDEEGADDDYWAQYDATPNAATPAAVRTPAAKNSPAPHSSIKHVLERGTGAGGGMTTAERAYLDMYEDVQPALDSHDPDEAADLAAAGIESTLNSHSLASSSMTAVELPADSRETDIQMTAVDGGGSERSSIVNVDIAHPRPESVASSRGAEAVERLEAAVVRREQTDFAIWQHVGRSVRGLWQLARGSGMGREEFEELVRGELETL